MTSDLFCARRQPTLDGSEPVGSAMSGVTCLQLDQALTHPPVMSVAADAPDKARARLTPRACMTLSASYLQGAEDALR